MTASYSEISFDTRSIPPTSDLRSLADLPEYNNKIDETDDFGRIISNSTRPDCLNIKINEKIEKKKSDSLSYSKAMSYLQFEGTVMNDGEMVLFVAEDLENKIKLSSPVTKKGDTFSLFESRNPVTCLYRQALTPQLPTFDRSILNELENEARKLATSVDSISENLAAILHSASALTVGCLETYRDAVCKTCDAIDHNIKSMYQLMAKCEELSKSMNVMHNMAEKLKDMKKILELFENAMNS